MFDSEFMIFDLPFFGLTYTSHEGWGYQALHQAGSKENIAANSILRRPALIDEVDRDGHVADSDLVRLAVRKAADSLAGYSSRLKDSGIGPKAGAA
ncbi:hypothetical protein ACO0LO_09325 [Undibacterium sp. TJN25]|uniref:hypothetical protein n=1 Tax=Undibacterium sp. TJN25 TaxID=3413056 RepID=UPI003BF25E89